MKPLTDMEIRNLLSAQQIVLEELQKELQLQARFNCDVCVTIQNHANAIDSIVDAQKRQAQVVEALRLKIWKVTV